MQKGFWDRQKYEQGLLRRVAYIVHASMVTKPLDPERLWPLDPAKKLTKEQLKKRSDVIMGQLELMQKIEDEKKKHGRAVKNNH